MNCKFIILTVFLVLRTMVSLAQTKTDTVFFTLHCLENEVEVEENLQSQLDSIYRQLGFLDSTVSSRIEQAIVFGFTDNKGSKKSNQLLSEKRAEYVAAIIRRGYSVADNIVMGFGETKPVASNKTEQGKANNRRVEVTLVYQQIKKKILPRNPDLPTKKLPVRLRDTTLILEDSTRLSINLADYELIKKSLSYKHSASLFDFFETLAINDTYDTYYRFSSITLLWDSIKGDSCLHNDITLSVKVPDVIVNESMKELKAYVKSFKGQNVSLLKRADGKWYLVVVTRCPFRFPGCGFRCPKMKQVNYKRIKYVAKDGYRILAAFSKTGNYFNYKKVKKATRKLKFGVACPDSLPEVSVVAIHKKNLDTLYYASGTELEIAHGKRCAKCEQEKAAVTSSMQRKTEKKTTNSQAYSEIKVENRFLRKKYKFRKENYSKRMVRKKMTLQKKK